MEREIIASKLDQLELEDLGISIDSGQLWDQLDARLETAKTRRLGWLVAASIALLVSVSISFLQNPKVPAPVAQVESIVGVTLPQVEKEVVIRNGNRIVGGVVPQTLRGYQNARLRTETLDFPIHLVNAKQIAILSEKGLTKSSFNNKDISVIQSSLGTRKTETGRKVTVRAQLYPSSDGSEISYQKLKIKLNAKNK